jgi:hypothetical protein
MTGTARRLPQVVVIAILVASGGCGSGAKDAPGAGADSAGGADTSGWTANRDGDRVFDPATLRVGDRVLGLRVAAADIALALDTTYVGEVRFAGRIRLRGTPVRHPDHPEVDLPCFDVDSSSVNVLPRWPRDERRRVWFCFVNAEEAVRLLGPPRDGRRVTLEIDDYQTVRRYTDAFDTARLIRVLPAPGDDE